MNRRNVPATHIVWNVTQDYCEHAGTETECVDWIRNVRDLGLSTDRFEVRR